MQNLFENVRRPWDLATELEARNAHLQRLCDEMTGRLNALEAAERKNLANLAAFQRENAALRERARDKTLRPMVRNTDGDTSREAEDGNRAIRREQIQKFVAVFQAAGDAGLTDEQAHDALGLQSHTPRVADMKRAGMLEHTGERRATKSGATARVYRLVKEWKGQTNAKTALYEIPEGGTEADTP